MLNRMNDAVISGNHHHRVGRPMLRSSHGMTPYIITRKASPNTAEDHLLAAGHDRSSASPASTLKCACVLLAHVGDHGAGRVAP